MHDNVSNKRWRRYHEQRAEKSPAVTNDYADGLTMREIAAKHGLTLSYVYKIISTASGDHRVLHRLKYQRPQRRLSTTQMELRRVVITDYETGLTMREIAAKHGLMLSHVHKIISTANGDHRTLHRINHQRRRFTAKAELWRAVKTDYASGLLIREIATKNNISFGSIYNLLRRQPPPTI